MKFSNTNGIRNYSKINSTIRLLLFLFWVVTDIFVVFLPNVYESLETVFGFGTTLFFATLYMARTNNIEAINATKLFLNENVDLKKKVKSKYYLRNFIAILILLAAFASRLMVRIHTYKVIFILASAVLLVLTEATMFLFTKSIVTLIDEYI